MKILVIGNGAREHALVKACLKSPKVRVVIAAPGNGGIAEEVKCFPVNSEDISDLVKLAKREKVDFVIIGPEVPLALGLVDELEKEKILAYGPNKKAAQLEASKCFSKEFLLKHKIPTAEGRSFIDSHSALEYIRSHAFPIVVKASGLAAGKGVIIAQNALQAQEAVHAMLEEDLFGEAGRKIVIESFLMGGEVSIMAVVAGENYIILPTSQDHKRIGEYDTGPNTGGMGAYAPADFVSPALLKEIEDTILRPTLKSFKKEGINFKGTLYVGLMITETGPKVLEFNVRFGDPETQVLLPLFETDVVEVLHACVRGDLSKIKVKFKNGYALGIVLSSEGYPENYKTGKKISFKEKCPTDVMVCHAATELKNKKLVTSGGRVLTVVGYAKNLQEAAQKAYEYCQKVEFEGRYFRRDIGAKELLMIDS